MIAIDTSSMVAFLAGTKGDDVEALNAALEQKAAVLPPVVLTELLSSRGLTTSVERLFQEIPLLPMEKGYWERAGKMRSRLITRGFKARLADTLIAQSCLDHEVPLITRDADFRHYARFENLKLV